MDLEAVPVPDPAPCPFGAFGASGARAESDDGTGDAASAHRSKAPLYVTLAVLVLAGVGIVALRGRTPAPAEELAALQSFVERSKTAHFEGTTRSEYGAGEEELGSTSVDRGRISGDLELPSSGRYVTEDGMWATETIVVGKKSWTRDGDDLADLADEKWVGYDEEEAMADAEGQYGFAPNTGAIHAAQGLFEVTAAPLELKNLLSRLRKVERESSTRLEAKATVRQLMTAEELREIEKFAAEAKEHLQKVQVEASEEAAADLPEGLDIEDMVPDFASFLDDEVTVTLHHDGDRLDRMEITVRSVGGEEEDRYVEQSDIRFSNWGEPVDIAAPDATDVDETPELDEEDLAAFKDFVALMPASLPADMVLEYAEVVEEDEEMETCGGVDLTYAREPADGDEAIANEIEYAPLHDLSITQTKATCKWPMWSAEDVKGARTVKIAGVDAQIGADPYADGEGLLVLMTVGDARLEVESSLPEAELLALLGSLKPIDVAELVKTHQAH